MSKRVSVLIISPEQQEKAKIQYENDEESFQFLGLTRNKFTRNFAVFLGVFGLGAFFALAYTGIMGENYTDFYDEDVTFFEKELHGESDSIYYWGLMALSFVLAFFSTVYRDTVRSVRTNLATSESLQFQQLYKTFYGNKYGFFAVSFLTVSWETVYETLWIFIALTDMWGVIFVLLGRVAAVLFLTVVFEKRFLKIESQIGGRHKTGTNLTF